MTSYSISKIPSEIRKKRREWAKKQKKDKAKKCRECGNVISKKKDPKELGLCDNCYEELSEEVEKDENGGTEMSSFKWVLAIGFGILLGFILLFAGCGLLLGYGANEAVKEMEKTSTPQTITPTGIIEDKPKVTEKLELRVGQSAQTTNLKVTVLSAMLEPNYWYTNIWGEEDSIFPSEGKQFVLTEVEFQNIGASSLYISGGSFSVQDSEGYRYDEGYYPAEDGLDMFKQLYPNQKTKGKIVFEVPEEGTSFEIIYNFGSLFTNVKLASWKV